MDPWSSIRKHHRGLVFISFNLEAFSRRHRGAVGVGDNNITFPLRCFFADGDRGLDFMR